MKKQLSGVGVALVTPFKSDGSIHFPSLEKLVELQINNGTDYLVVMGTTGESATLNKAEKAEVLEFVKKVNNDRLPVVLGLGGNNTLELGEQLESLNAEGLTAILSVSPYYNKPTQEGIYKHYEYLAERSPLPIILYNVPGRTSSNIAAQTTLRLAKNFKQIVAIKEASGDLEQIMEIVRHKPEEFMVISGDDALTLPIIASGGDGVISVVANAFPNAFSFMVHQAMDCNYGQARTTHYKLFEVIQQLFVDGNPAGVKAALKMRDICEEHVRLPLVPVSDETRSRLKFLIQDNKLIK